MKNRIKEQDDNFYNTLLIALKEMFDKDIEKARYDTKQLHGGTLGDVKLVYGTLITKTGETLEYKVVYKNQKKWKRYSDDNSWRREYDLYKSDLGNEFTNNFRWPICYYTNISKNELQIWMEYIDGVTGDSLTADMCEAAARALGRFQGKLFAEKPKALDKIRNLSNVGFLRQNYLNYRSWPEVYDYIRSDDCDLPKHICEMMIEIDENEERVWREIGKLPIVLCQRDFWNANIFYTENQIICIDWDTTGWGRLGEDIASLIADVEDSGNIVECFKRCVPAYLSGFSEYHRVDNISRATIYHLIIVMFGYRYIENYKFAKTDQDKKLSRDILKKLFNIRVELTKQQKML